MIDSRRTFIKNGLAAAVGSQKLLAQGTSPKRKLRIAGIGVGSMGHNNLTNLAAENIVALCDVDHVVAQKSFKKFPDAKRWKDFREMLKKQDDIEAVMIATPDHTHASIAMAALKAGKHVYCQKPITHDIYESRLLATAAAEAKGCVAVMGNQHHSSTGARKIVDWVRAGLIGDVERVIAWCMPDIPTFRSCLLVISHRFPAGRNPTGAGDDQGGAVLIGSNGIICHGTYPGSGLTLLPKTLRKEASEIKSTLPNLRGSHEAIWAAACKGEGPGLSMEIVEITSLAAATVPVPEERRDLRFMTVLFFTVYSVVSSISTLRFYFSSGRLSVRKCGRKDAFGSLAPSMTGSMPKLSLAVSSERLLPPSRHPDLRSFLLQFQHGLRERFSKTHKGLAAA